MRDNLFVFARNETMPLWSRKSVEEAAQARLPEKGRYGTPTLPDGRREELPQNDAPVFAPLSIAVDREPQLTRVATADYQGWQRWIRSSASGQQHNYGTRFVPTRPTVSVYDHEGNKVWRFNSELFKPVWVDLAFLPGAKQLVAYPHHWACRGLAGQTVLPADDDARTLWLLDIETGNVRQLDLPDAICDVAIGNDGTIAATCWDGRLYLLTAKSFHAKVVPTGIDRKINGPLLRDSVPAADFDSDGIDDLILGKGQDQRLLVLLGSRDGLKLERSVAFDLDYRLHYETGLLTADFNGDGRLDIASLGDTKTGVGAGGPLAVYIYLRYAR